MNHNKLQKNDIVQVIAPSNSYKPISNNKDNAQKKFEEDLGLSISYSKNCMSLNEHNSSSIEERVDDIHAAFSNPKVKAIICATGGYNSNELLNYIDWNIIKKNPKPFIGSSDITVLINAIFAKTGNTTFFGPNFFKFGMKKDLDYTINSFKKTLMEKSPYSINKSEQWSNDRWYINQDKRNLIKNSGPIIINQGIAEGISIGGNLCSLNLLQGTEFMPSLKDTILFLEDDDLAGEHTFGEFSRNLESLLQLPNSDKVKAIVLGRFQPTSNMTQEKIYSIFKHKNNLKNIPIIAGVDFGHTDPTITLPIGNKVKIVTSSNETKITFI